MCEDLNKYCRSALQGRKVIPPTGPKRV